MKTVLNILIVLSPFIIPLLLLAIGAFLDKRDEKRKQRANCRIVRYGDEIFIIKGD